MRDPGTAHGSNPYGHPPTSIRETSCGYGPAVPSPRRTCPSRWTPFCWQTPGGRPDRPRRGKRRPGGRAEHIRPAPAGAGGPVRRAAGLGVRWRRAAHGRRRRRGRRGGCRARHPARAVRRSGTADGDHRRAQRARRLGDRAAPRDASAPPPWPRCPRTPSDPAEFAARVGSDDLRTQFLPVGQDAFLAASFARRWKSVGDAVRGIRAAISAAVEDDRPPRRWPRGRRAPGHWAPNSPSPRGR